ncbi:MAG: hypothetical protein AAF405_06895, partial [Pseudomonadota bacterium]
MVAKPWDCVPQFCGALKLGEKGWTVDTSPRVFVPRKGPFKQLERRMHDLAKEDFNEKDHPRF